jgi:hypothetical protein
VTSTEPAGEGLPARPSRVGRIPIPSEGPYRLLVSGLVVLVLAGLLVAGAIVKTERVANSAVTSGPLGAYPAASLSSPEASMWACPGPLPAGGGQARSSVEIVNTGSSRVALSVAGASTALSGDGGSPLGIWSRSATVNAHSSMVVPLPSSGPAQSDAVTVLAGSSAVAAFEVVAPTVSPSANSPKPATLQSPCELGTTKVSFIPSGTTTNKSTEVVSAYNPTATEAVVGMSVASTSSSVSPPALQGLTIKPYSLQTYNIGTWVVQHPTVAVTVSATVGQVAVGTLETQSSTGSTGESLEIGEDQLSTVWTLTPGVMVLGRTVAIRVYDPSTRATTVSISSPVSGGPSIDLTASVAAEGARTILLPPSISQRPKAGAPPIVEGPIVIRTSEGVGVAVARLGAADVASRLMAVGTMAATAAAPESQWLLPDSGAAGEAIVAANPGKTTVNVELYGLSASGGGLKGITQITLPPQARKTFVVLGTSYSALFLSASQQFVVDAGAEATQGLTRVPAGASPVEAIPVLG